MLIINIIMLSFGLEINIKLGIWPSKKMVRQLVSPPISSVLSRSLPSKTDHPFQKIVQAIAHQQITADTGQQLKQIHDVLQYYPHTIYYAVSKALQWKIGQDSSAKLDENLYLADSNIAQIDLFRLLIEELPHVAWAQDVVNKMIVDICLPYEQVVLIDIGIGTAHQCGEIIRQLAKKSTILKEITIVGIEPATDSLVIAQDRLHKLQQETGVRLNFQPISACVEDISIDTWQSLAEQCQHQKVVINASFALHHLKNNPQHPNIRTDIFKFLYNFQPLALLLSEPNSDHLNPDFAQRLENCLYHFNLVFQLINDLAISEDEKRALKLFFSREIKDIIGNQEARRSERHELATTWVDRLQQANFKLQDDFSRYLPTAVDLIDIRSTADQFLSFEYQQASLVAVMCATPAQT
jgi:GRAS domain family